MVRAIIAWSLQNRLIVILAVCGLVGMGVHAALNLNVEAYPDPTPPLVEVIAQNPGASPEEMERLVGIPLETALNGMPGLEDLRSTSIAGLTDIKCQFAYGTDYGQARQEVLNRIAYVDLPNGVKPKLSPWSPTGEIVRYVLEGPGYTLNQLKAAQDWVLNRALKQVPGVIDVTGYGGTVKQYQILLDPDLLRRYGVTLEDVENAVAKSNANVGGDLLSLGSQVHNVRAVGLLGGGVDPLDPARTEDAPALEAQKIEDLEDVIVATNAGTPLFVKQLAKVIVGHQPRLGVVGRTVGKADENDVIEGIVLMRKYEKSLPTSKKVQEKIDELNRGGLLPKGMRIVPFNRRTDLVHVTTENVLHNLLMGMGLVVVVLFVFLGDLASAGIVALVIPLALFFAIGVLYLQGKSANLLSIGAVDFGIIVDSSVIIVENIYRHVTEHGADRSRPLTDRIAEASREIERPLFFATAILICAFVPLFALSGPAGALFGPMANTYAFSILGALLIATTLAPVLCSFFFHNKKEEKETLIDRAMKGVYRVSLRVVLRHRYLVLLAAGGLLAFTAALVPTLGGEFMPELEEGNLWIRAILPRTVSLAEAARFAPKIREVIGTVPEVKGVMSHVGRPDDGTDVTSFFNVELNVPLRPMEQWRKKPITWFGYKVGERPWKRTEIEDELIAKFAAFPGVSFSFSQLIRDNVEEALSGVKGANSVKLFGSELGRLEEVGGRVAKVLRGVPGIENVGLFHIVGQPNLEIQIDRVRCARYGINVADVEAAVQVAIGGKAFSQMVEGEKLYDIVLRYPEHLRDDPTDIARLPIDTPGGARIPLAQVATIVPHKPGASYIYRENNSRYLPIKFGVRGSDLATAIARAQAEVKTSGVLPETEGYRLEWSGEFAQMEDANATLMVIVPVSVVLILVILYTAFNSAKDAMLVMANVLTAAMGGIWALKLTGIAFSISAAVGFISIFGVVVQNGVLMIAQYKRLRLVGETTQQAVMTGSIILLRPIVMIGLTAILGLLPAALADSIGSQAQKPLAIVVVGGMAVSLVLGQFLMPALYLVFPGRDVRSAGVVELEDDRPEAPAEDAPPDGPDADVARPG